MIVALINSLKLKEINMTYFLLILCLSFTVVLLTFESGYCKDPVAEELMETTIKHEGARIIRESYFFAKNGGYCPDLIDRYESPSSPKHVQLDFLITYAKGACMLGEDERSNGKNTIVDYLGTFYKKVNKFMDNYRRLTR